jgi:hypothetical protein
MSAPEGLPAKAQMAALRVARKIREAPSAAAGAELILNLVDQVGRTCAVANAAQLDQVMAMPREQPDPTELRR